MSEVKYPKTLIHSYINKDFRSLDYNACEYFYFKKRDPVFGDVKTHSLEKKARDHITLLLLVFMRFKKEHDDKFPNRIDKFLFLDIMSFLPTGSYFHFKDETVRFLSVEKLIFNYSTFKNTNFENCHICHAFFRNALIEDCTFTKTCIEEGDFSYAKIKNTKFNKVNLTMAMYSSAELEKVSFEKVWMEKINFSSYKVHEDKNTLIKNCKFEKCEMREAWFTHNINMYDTEFTTCNLCYAKFGEGIFHESNYMRDCGVMGLEITEDNYFSSEEISEIDWYNESQHSIWDNFEEEGHLPYTPYSHDNISGPGVYVGPPPF